ncbi:MAG: hypothetical protein AB8F78_03415 [Saprospiraceae bacterium]
MNQVRFDMGEIRVFDLDSLGIQSFRSSNIQYIYSGFSLFGNSFQLTNGFSDLILSHLSYDTWSYRRDQGPSLGVGFQALLPLGGNKIAYMSETFYEAGDDVPYFFLRQDLSLAIYQ